VAHQLDESVQKRDGIDEPVPVSEAGRDVLRIGHSTTHLGYNLRDSWWGVSLTPVLPIVPEQFGQLSKVSVPREGFLDSLAVEDVGIRVQLNPVISNTTAHFQHEVLGVLAGTLAYQKRRNEFGVRVQRHENPLIAKLCGIVLPNVPSLLGNEHPDFVALDSTARQLARIRASGSLSLRLPARTSSRMIVLRLMPVSLSVERIAASNSVRMVPRCDTGWGSQKVDLQEVQRQRWTRRLLKYPNFLAVPCSHLWQVMAFLRLISAGKSHILG
jgi:hypothetical protein